MERLVDRMILAAKLDTHLYEEVEADRNATRDAMLVVLISSLAAGIGGISRGGFLGLIVGLLAALVGWVIWAALIYFIGTRLLPEPQTRADVGELLRTIGFAMSPGVIRVLAIVPFLGWIVNLVATIWMISAMIIAVRQALDYTSTLRAAAVCLIGFVAYFVFAMVISGVFGL